MKPFEKQTAVQLWTDPYIAKQMLTYHLSLDIDVASRNINTIEKTVEFLTSSLMKNKQSILDLGCGPGLYTNLFSKAGYTVKGIDVSVSSIDYAKSINQNVIYELDNYVDMEPRGVFDLITMIYCDFSVLGKKERSKLLGNVYAMLNKDGHFAFDVHNMRYYNQFKTGVTQYAENDGFYMTGECNIKIEKSIFSDEKVCLTHITADGEKQLEFYNWIQCYSKESITNLLHQNGFKVVDIYSDTMGNKDFQKGDAMFIIAKKDDENR